MHSHPRPYAVAKPLALLVAAAFSAPLLAQQAENTLAEVKVKEQVSKEQAYGPVQGYRATRSATFTKTDTDLKEVPASVTVIPAELMKDQSMQSMADVIRYVPGATNHQGEGNRDQFVLRGISTSADFYVDGVRDDAQIFRDLYNLERVEVLKGTGGMIFGRGGAGGVVNRVTKRADFTNRADVTVSAGTLGDLRSNGDFSGKFSDTAAWRLNVMGEDSNGFRDHFKLKREAINPTITFAPGGNTTLTVGYEHLNDERTADRGVPSRNGLPINADRERFYGNADQSQARSTVDGIYAILDHDLGNGFQVKNTFRATHYDKFYQNVYPDNGIANAVNAAGQMKLSAYNNANRRTNVFNQTDLTTKVTLGGFEHSLLAGIELGHQNSVSQRNTGFFGASTTATVSADAPYAVATSFRANGSDANSIVQSDIAALYIQDQITLSKEWKLLAGLRYDHFKTTFDDRRTTTTQTDLARTDSEVSPRLGLIWSPNANSTYYASYSYSFLPSGETLTLAPNTADLAPEKAKNYEVGGRWDLLPKLTLSAAAFRLDRDDVRSPDPVHTGYFVKTGQQRTEGVEIGLQGEITRHWLVYAGYANLDGRITKTTSGATAGAQLQLVPQNMFSLWNRFELGNGWGAGLGVVYQGESFATLENRVKLPSFTRTDGAMYYTFSGGKTRLALNVENLFDKKYFPTADGNNNIAPGAPRNARLTLSTSF